MCEIMENYKNDIENYCDNNSLSVQKLYHSPMSYNKEVVFLQYYDPNDVKNAVIDSTPAPITLIIEKQDTGITFKQTEFTKQYLSI